MSPQDKDKVYYHLELSENMLEGAQYALVPGDPGRVEALAKAFDPNAKALASHREYTSFLATFHGQKVLVTSTGIGGPSTSIAVEELASVGIRYFLRVGSCGAIQEKIKPGELVITRGAVRLDGASSHYAPIEYPAVASLHLTSMIVDAAEELGVPYHVGITASSDTFYPGQERYNNYSKYVIRRFQGSIAEWQHLNVSNYEMESATLLTMANVFDVHAACMCGVVANRVLSEEVDPNMLKASSTHWEKTAVRAIELSMRKRGFIK